MQQESTEFKWNKKREEAAHLVADDRLSDEAIAEKLEIDRATLWRWKKHEVFAARVAEIVDRTRRAILTKGIADRVRRVAALDDRWNRMQKVIDERAKDPEMQHVPGGPTGLLVHQVKGVGKGEDFQLIDLYMVDSGLLAELRNHEKQSAQELGQWVERKTSFDLDSADLSILNDDELDRLIAGEDPGPIFAAAGKRLAREKAAGAGSTG